MVVAAATVVATMAPAMRAVMWAAGEVMRAVPMAANLAEAVETED